MPPAKPESSLQSFNLAEGSLSNQAEAIIKAVGRGELPSSNANELLSAISLGLKIKETEEFERRVQVLEDIVGVKEKELKKLKKLSTTS